jgi:predicted nuclease with TOPRIM domain
MSRLPKNLFYANLIEEKEEKQKIHEKGLFIASKLNQEKELVKELNKLNEQMDEKLSEGNTEECVALNNRIHRINKKLEELNRVIYSDFYNFIEMYANGEVKKTARESHLDYSIRTYNIGAAYKMLDDIDKMELKSLKGEKDGEDA